MTTDYCTTCEQYVGTVHLILDNPSTKTEVLNELTSLCTQYIQTKEIVSIIKLNVDKYNMFLFNIMIILLQENYIQPLPRNNIYGLYYLSSAHSSNLLEVPCMTNLLPTWLLPKSFALH